VQENLIKTNEEGGDDGVGGGLVVNNQHTEKKPTQPEAAEHFWEEHEHVPWPVFETVVRYLPLSQLIWIPICHLNLRSMKLQVDLDFLLRIYDLVQQCLPEQDREGVTARAIEEAYSVVDQGIDIPSAKLYTRNSNGAADGGGKMSYVERLTVAATSLEIELNLKRRAKKEKAKDEKGETVEKTKEDDENVKKDNNEGDEESEENVHNDNLSALNSMGRNTSSGSSAAALTWVRNVAR